MKYTLGVFDWSTLKQNNKYLEKKGVKCKIAK